MKAFVFVGLLLMAFNSFAEVKPDGALVPTQCGKNVAEAPMAGPNYPVEVCTYAVAGSGDIAEFKVERPIFSLENFEGEKNYYMALGLVQKDFDEWVWQGYKLNVNEGQYTFVDAANPIDLSVPMVQITQLLDGTKIRLIGPMIQADLEFVFVTQGQ